MWRQLDCRPCTMIQLDQRCGPTQESWWLQLFYHLQRLVVLTMLYSFRHQLFHALTTSMITSTVRSQVISQSFIYTKGQNSVLGFIWHHSDMGRCQRLLDVKPRAPLWTIYTWTTLRKNAGGKAATLRKGCCVFKHRRQILKIILGYNIISPCLSYIRRHPMSETCFKRPCQIVSTTPK